MPPEDTILLLRVTLLFPPQISDHDRAFIYILYTASYIWVSHLDPQIQHISHLVLDRISLLIGQREGEGTWSENTSSGVFGSAGLMMTRCNIRRMDGCMYDRWM